MFTYASIPNNGIIKTRSATASSRTSELTFNFAAAGQSWVLCPQNVNRTYLTIRNMSTTNPLFYTYVSYFTTNNPTLVPTTGTAGVTVVAVGTQPAWPSTGGPFVLYQKQGVAGVTSKDTNWALYDPSVQGYKIELQQALILDDIQNVVIATDAAVAAFPVYIDEGSIL